MRIGLVGYGHGGRFFHAPLIATLPGATFVGVVTRSPERRQQLSTDLPGVKAFDSIGQIVEAGVDALVISTTLKGRPAKNPVARRPRPPAASARCAARC